MDDLFRSFFNIPHKKDFSGRGELPEWSDDQSNEAHNFGSSFESFLPQDVFRHMDEMFSSMEKMMKFGDQPQFGFQSIIPGEGSEQSPRDQMLKDDSDSTLERPNGRSQLHKNWRNELESNKKEDIDLDGIASNPTDLDRIMSGKSNEDRMDRESESRRRHWSSSFSSVTVRGPDGNYEQKETRRDTEGNTEKVTKRTIDGQTCSERIVTDPRGKILEEWSDCTAELLKKQSPSFKTSEGDSSSFAPPVLYGHSNSDDHSIFRNIFGPDLPKSDC